MHHHPGNKPLFFGLLIRVSDTWYLIHKLLNTDVSIYAFHQSLGTNCENHKSNVSNRQSWWPTDVELRHLERVGQVIRKSRNVRIFHSTPLYRVGVVWNMYPFHNYRVGDIWNMYPFHNYSVGDIWNMYPFHFIGWVLFEICTLFIITGWVIFEICTLFILFQKFKPLNIFFTAHDPTPVIIPTSMSYVSRWSSTCTAPTWIPRFGLIRSSSNRIDSWMRMGSLLVVNVWSPSHWVRLGFLTNDGDGGAWGFFEFSKDLGSVHWQSNWG